MTLKKDKYEAALTLLNLEAGFLSSIFGSFLLAHSIIVGSLMQAILNKDFNFVATWDSKIFSFCILGFFLAGLWLIAYLRGASFYALRSQQVLHNEPADYHLYKNIDSRFVKGEEIEIGEKKIKINRLGKVLSARTVTVYLITTFVILYLLGFLFFGPWWPSNSVANHSKNAGVDVVETDTVLKKEIDKQLADVKKSHPILTNESKKAIVTILKNSNKGITKAQIDSILLVIDNNGEAK